MIDATIVTGTVSHPQIDQRPTREAAVDERELILRAVRGDAVAERALYELHVGRVYRMAYRMVGDATLAEDFTQEVFVRAFARLAKFEFRSRLSTWLHSITTSVVLNGMRKHRKQNERERANESLESLPVGRSDPEVTLRLTLHAAIDDLNEGQRSVFIMHDLEGFTHREIASSLGVEEGTSKARLSRARARLREVLIQAGVRAPRFSKSESRTEENGS